MLIFFLAGNFISKIYVTQTSFSYPPFTFGLVSLVMKLTS